MPAARVNIRQFGLPLGRFLLWKTDWHAIILRAAGDETQAALNADERGTDRYGEAFRPLAEF